ncbi:RNA recognition motif domain-containing protein [Pajaroellobacter abortibovis]|uniref:RRM domain-containing protein n=1 Tax=Pajaroellobacter abortibovis TaxID=1882918 RepID=A0A1L6MVD9_9BACT|nr:hypothetical protein [Pajaroellobacter abortibovis]APR99476.1 hypothetical protein BCY86_01360 [Pajaroellobacter abortibovis]
MVNEETKLFVSGLPDSISEDILKQIFEATGGTVVNLSLPKDRTTGRPRGFGFVTLSTSSQAATARDTLDGSMQNGKLISVRPFQAEPPRRNHAGFPGGGSGEERGSSRGNRLPKSSNQQQGAPDRTLYVGNLPYDCTPEELETLIHKIVDGSVQQVNLPVGMDGRKRGFGFVTMASPEAAKTVASSLQSVDLRGRRLIVNLAHAKGERSLRSEGPSYSSGMGYMPNFMPAQVGGGSHHNRKNFDDRRRKYSGRGDEEGAHRPRRREQSPSIKDWSDDDDD